MLFGSTDGIICFLFFFSNFRYPSALAFWRVENSLGTFLPADPMTLGLLGGSYELRNIKFGLQEFSPKASKNSDAQAFSTGDVDGLQSGKSSSVNSARRFEAVASFQLIWWNRTSTSRKKFSIWRPIVPQGMVYFGDIAVKGYVVLIMIVLYVNFPILD